MGVGRRDHWDGPSIYKLEFYYRFIAPRKFICPLSCVLYMVGMCSLFTPGYAGKMDSIIFLKA